MLEHLKKNMHLCSECEDSSSYCRNYQTQHNNRSCAQVCTLRSEAKPPEEAFKPAVKRSGWQPPKDTGLWEIAGQVQDQVCAPSLFFMLVLRIQALNFKKPARFRLTFHYSSMMRTWQNFPLTGRSNLTEGHITLHRSVPICILQLQCSYHCLGMASTFFHPWGCLRCLIKCQRSC